MYSIQHGFICLPSDSTVSEDAGIEPRTVPALALAVRRSITTRLELISLPIKYVYLLIHSCWRSISMQCTPTVVGAAFYTGPQLLVQSPNCTLYANPVPRGKDERELPAHISGFSPERNIQLSVTLNRGTWPPPESCSLSLLRWNSQRLFSCLLFVDFPNPRPRPWSSFTLLEGEVVCVYSIYFFWITV